MIRLIATDLDGTLFYPKRKIKLVSSKNRKFLQEYIKQGNKVVLVSGRNKDISEQLSRKIGVSIDMIACNGSVIFKDGKIVEDKPMNLEDVRRLFLENKNDSNILSWVFMAKDKPMIIVARNTNKFVELIYRIALKFQFRYMEKHVIGEKYLMEALDDPETKIYKVMPLFGVKRAGERRARENLDKYFDAYGTNFEILWSGSALEFMNKGVNKANALKKFINMLELKSEDVAVVGDSGNDVPLFEAFENSFVMAQAPEEVKAKAKTVIEGVYCLKDYIK